MRKQQQFDESQLGSNPFVQTLQIDVTEVIKNDTMNLDTDGTWVHGTMYWEKMQKAEVYYCPGCSGHVAELSDRAQRLYLHIIYSLEPKKDYLRLNAQHYMNKNGIKSHTTYSNALNELIRYQFIVATHIKGVYWLNPLRFFPGSRISKYPDKKNIKQKWDQTSL